MREEDPGLFAVAQRMARFEEWEAIVHAHTRDHSTADLIERASALRIPVAPVCNGRSVLAHPHLKARGVFVRDAFDAFTHPRAPYAIAGVRPPMGRVAPRLGELAWSALGRGARGAAPESEPASRIAFDAEPAFEPASTPARDAKTGSGPLPLEGLRVLDLTAWWAGPSATHMLATLGADVVHVEATQRLDGMRMTGGMLKGRAPRWWEYSAFFLAANANKRGITLNLTDPEGVALARRLIADADAVVENFTPRVLDGFGLGWDVIHADDPSTILVRMPAFGLDGPWREHTGFAQTMEQLSGMAWVTGHADDQPRIQRGPCDPLAGMHAAWALLVALAEREVTGRGSLVEVTMVEGALNAAAEQVIEWTAHGRLLEREGNRAPEAAPQGLYAAAGSTPGDEDWLALSVERDAQWQALCAVIGREDWRGDAGLSTRAGRRARHDEIDVGLRAWARTRSAETAVEDLTGAGVPAGRVVDGRRASRQPQIAARGFFEPVEHPVVGRHATPTVPFRFDGVDRWVRRPAPTVGQHGREILRERLGLDEDELDRLEARAVIGEAPSM
jgi:crotonobetainyl-CoA:carnitine CoA-transferase CaiB-like acyl-CoA transferase